MKALEHLRALVEFAYANGYHELGYDPIEEVKNGWQPIATAPRDGTPVDLWHKDGFRDADQWWDDTDGDACWTSLFGDDQYTHWKPLTEPDSIQTG